MELSSMLAGERFTDRPRCVDPVIAAYMRALNDRLGARDRQRLFPYAARVVGTAGDRRCRRARRELCLAYLGYGPGGAWRARLRVAAGIGIVFALLLDEPAAELAARRVVAARDVEGAFALLDALIGVGAEPELEPAPLAGAVAGVPEFRVPSGVA